MSYATDLVDEGLAYFEKSGDAGDKEYVKAIRQHIAHLSAQAKVRVTDQMVMLLRRLLIDAGYEVIEWEDARSALEACFGSPSQGAQTIPDAITHEDDNYTGYENGWNAYRDELIRSLDAFVRRCSNPGHGVQAERDAANEAVSFMQTHGATLISLLSQGAQGDPREPRGQYLAHITANQAQNLLDYFGGGSTTYTLIRCEAGDCAQDDGSPAPAGLYVYDANCPEEGVNYLGEEDEDSQPRARRDHRHRAAVPDRVIARGVFDELVSAMSSDNNVFFRAESEDYDHVLGAVESMVRAGYFRSDVLDLDGDYWQMAAGEETEKKEHFKDAPADALATIDAVLNDIFDRPLPDVKRAAVPEGVQHALDYLHTFVTSSHNTGWQKNREMWDIVRRAALTAAPQPPEGARVVDGDDRVLWGVVANAGRLSDRPRQRWAHVVDATGMGSQSSIALCQRFGFDPDETIPAPTLAGKEGA